MIIHPTGLEGNDMDEDLYMHLSGLATEHRIAETLLQIAESTPFILTSSFNGIHEQGSWMERRRTMEMQISKMSRGLGVSTEPVVRINTDPYKAIGFPIAEQEWWTLLAIQMIEFPDEHRGQLHVPQPDGTMPKVVVATDEPPFIPVNGQKISAPVAI
ncbi:hypothetical protein SPFM7_00043 [Salmonella phage SPFM7]|nr:hypothetical protein SPFM7_00043 [Salmonella phage SPFM7]